MNKQSLTTNKAYLAYFVIAIVIGLVLTFRYLHSFASVSFNYQSSMGSITLVNSNEQTFKPEADQPIKLKKGNYTVRASGHNIASNTQTITIDGHKDTYKIKFKYTVKYLEQLYKKEQLAIYTAMLLDYPKISSDYTVSGDKLYDTGQWFGAALMYNDRQSDNRDTLHILMKKQDGEWQVVSTPPQPVLSKQKYPDAPYDTLKAINQAL